MPWFTFCCNLIYIYEHLQTRTWQKFKFLRQSKTQINIKAIWKDIKKIVDIFNLDQNMEGLKPLMSSHSINWMGNTGQPCTLEVPIQDPR